MRAQVEKRSVLGWNKSKAEGGVSGKDHQPDGENIQGDTVEGGFVNGSGKPP